MSTPSGRRFTVRRSPIHGRGVYAAVELPAGEELIEYRGEVIAWETATERYLASGDGALTYFFDRGDGTVIDGASNGNSARFINHGCEPNCEALDADGRIYIYTREKLKPGQELLIDYALVVDDPGDPELAALYGCECGAPTCRKTMLAPTAG